MQQNKTIFILFGILLILIALFGWQRFNQQKLASQIVDSSYVAQLNNLQPETISQFTLTKNDESLEFSKGDSIWRVNNFEADAEAVNNLLNNLFSPTNVEKVAVTNSRHKDFGIATTSAVLVSIPNTPSITVGDSTGDGYYVRFNTNDSVYLVHGLPFQINELTLDSWRNQIIVAATKDDIASISFSDTNGEWNLEHKDTNWFLGDKQVDVSSISTFLNSLELLRSQGFLAEAKREMYSQKPYLEITITTNSGDRRLSLYSPVAKASADKTDVLVETNRDNGLYLLAKPSAENLALNKDSLVFSETK